MEKISSDYLNLADYILLDESGGTGRKMNIGKMDEYLDEIYSMNIQNSCLISIAGGLCADNLEQLKPLISKYNNLSIDAESKLIDSGNDNLIPQAMVEYIHTAKMLFNSTGRK